MSTVSGPSGAALASLSQEDADFLLSLPKAELHAHLNGCIPLECLQELARERLSANNSTIPSIHQASIQALQDGVKLEAIGDFFGLFPAIYDITSTPETISRAASAVLLSFLGPFSSSTSDGSPLPQCSYLELRTTPRATPHMTRRVYLESVLDVIEKYSRKSAALIVSLDRRMTVEIATECVALAIELKEAGRAVVGVDLCGDPLAGEMDSFKEQFTLAKRAGLGVTLHIAETVSNPTDETMKFLGWGPNRLGHATFLDDAACQFVERENIAIEICLSSNLLCKTVSSLEDHHIRYWLERNHPIVICTDDTLPFRTTLLAEYALLLAQAPLGLGFSREKVADIAKRGLESRFNAV